mmetsp:Transcript_36333/g.58730  ORF Transcript_36333/g.58730 Transcript_36333/m.58730 type:complete len:327 (-) Transcript_36333:3748-4728(-)
MGPRPRRSVVVVVVVVVVFVSRTRPLPASASLCRKSPALLSSVRAAFASETQSLLADAALDLMRPHHLPSTVASKTPPLAAVPPPYLAPLASRSPCLPSCASPARMTPGQVSPTSTLCLSAPPPVHAAAVASPPLPSSPAHSCPPVLAPPSSLYPPWPEGLLSSSPQPFSLYQTCSAASLSFPLLLSSPSPTWPQGSRSFLLSHCAFPPPASAVPPRHCAPPPPAPTFQSYSARFSFPYPAPLSYVQHHSRGRLPRVAAFLSSPRTLLSPFASRPPHEPNPSCAPPLPFADPGSFPVLPCWPPPCLPPSSHPPPSVLVSHPPLHCS